jgi:ABC-2 type transport system permease protein
MTTILRSEWTKVRSLRSTVWTLATMALLVPAFAVIVGATKSLQPDDTILGGSLTGAGGGLIAAAVFGVLVMSGEYSSGSIHSTITATPRRSRVLAAKAVLVAGLVFPIAVLSAFVSFQIGQLFLGGGDYPTGDPFPALLGVGLCFSAAGLVGLALATMLRHTAGAVTAAIAVVLLPALIGPLFGDWQGWVAGSSPVSALEKLSQTSDAAPEVVGTLGAWSSLALVGCYAAVALAAGAWLLRTRDV